MSDTGEIPNPKPALSDGLAVASPKSQVNPNGKNAKEKQMIRLFTLLVGRDAVEPRTWTDEGVGSWA